MILDAEPLPFQPSTIAARLRRARRWLALGAVVYAVVLLAGLPARMALHWAGIAGAEDATGTVWNGAERFGAVTMTWRVAPLRSITRFALSGDIAVTGGDTRLAGQANWRPGWIELSDLNGRAGWPLVAALEPKLPFSCDLAFDVTMRRIVLAGARSGADGDLASNGGRCTSSAATGPDVPALIGKALMEGRASRMWIAPTARPAQRLAEAGVSRDGKLTVSILPAATALLPAGANLGAVAIETAL